jgi:hypothetical protein
MCTSKLKCIIYEEFNQTTGYLSKQVEAAQSAYNTVNFRQSLPLSTGLNGTNQHREERENQSWHSVSTMLLKGYIMLIFWGITETSHCAMHSKNTNLTFNS